MDHKLISKDKLPKGSSYPMQTKYIEEHLKTDSLCLHYSNLQWRRKFDWSLSIPLMTFSVRKDIYEPPLDHDFFINVYSVPSDINHNLKFALRNKILPVLAKWQNVNNRGHSANVFYRSFHESNWEPLDFGGLYVVIDQYRPKETLLYRDETFNIDSELKVIYEKK